MIVTRRSHILIWVPLFCLAFFSLVWLHLGGRLKLQHPHLTFAANTTTTTTTTTNTRIKSETPPFARKNTLISFWDALSTALLNAKPPCALPPSDNIKAPVTKFANLKRGSKRPDFLQISQQDVDSLKDAHSRFVEQIPYLASQFPYVYGSKGIVTTAAGEFLPTLVVSLRMLRRTGSKLPVQVLVEDRAVYEERICEEVLPPMNATCFLLSDILDAVPQRIEIYEPRFQLRAFAMLFSSFDDMLLLDADSIAVEKPEDSLNAEPFTSTGFVNWPDYWPSTASPKYYEISSQPTPAIIKRASSDSGQLLLSKSKHAPTLLLSLYYNLYGPSHYYTLLSQNSIGKGDKETYLAAATSLNASVYTVNTNIDELGFTDYENHFRGCGASQLNAQDDYKKHALHNTSITTSSLRRSYIHAQTYRMNAAWVPELFHNEINMRMWGDKEKMVGKFGRDVEKQLWAETLAVGCQYEKYFFDWKGKQGVCKGVGRVYNFVATL